MQISLLTSSTQSFISLCMKAVSSPCPCWLTRQCPSCLTADPHIAGQQGHAGQIRPGGAQHQLRLQETLGRRSALSSVPLLASRCWSRLNNEYARTGFWCSSLGRSGDGHGKVCSECGGLRFLLFSDSLLVMEKSTEIWRWPAWMRGLGRTWWCRALSWHLFCYGSEAAHWKPPV